MLFEKCQSCRRKLETIAADLVVSGETIERICAPGAANDETAYDLTGCTILPGFIDMHIHGCAGADTGDATPKP